MFLNVENSKFTIVFEQESESKTAIIYTIPPELRVDGSIFTCGKVLDDGCFYFTYRTYYYPHKDYLYECYDKKCVCNVRYSEIVKYDPLTGKFESVFRPEEKSFVVDIEKDCCYVFKENYIYRYDYLTQQYSPTQLFDYGKWVDEREYVAVDKAVGDFKPLPDSYVHDRDVYLARKISGDRFMVRYLNSYNVY